jgi:hypothetical protein
MNSNLCSNPSSPKPPRLNPPSTLISIILNHSSSFKTSTQILSTSTRTQQQTKNNRRFIKVVVTIHPSYQLPLPINFIHEGTTKKLIATSPCRQSQKKKQNPKDVLHFIGHGFKSHWVPHINGTRDPVLGPVLNKHKF